MKRIYRVESGAYSDKFTIAITESKEIAMKLAEREAKTSWCYAGADVYATIVLDNESQIDDLFSPVDSHDWEEGKANENLKDELWLSDKLEQMEILLCEFNNEGLSNKHKYFDKL